MGPFPDSLPPQYCNWQPKQNVPIPPLFHFHPILKRLSYFSYGPIKTKIIWPWLTMVNQLSTLLFTFDIYFWLCFYDNKIVCTSFLLLVFPFSSNFGASSHQLLLSFVLFFLYISPTDIQIIPIFIFLFLFNALLNNTLQYNPCLFYFYNLLFLFFLSRTNPHLYSFNFHPLYLNFYS